MTLQRYSFFLPQNHPFKRLISRHTASYCALRSLNSAFASLRFFPVLWIKRSLISMRSRKIRTRSCSSVSGSMVNTPFGRVGILCPVCQRVKGGCKCMRVERGRRYELRHNTNATALICAAGLLFPACCRSFPAVSRRFPFPAPSRYGLCTVAYSGVSTRSIGWLSVRLSRMGATQLHYHFPIQPTNTPRGTQAFGWTVSLAASGSCTLCGIYPTSRPSQLLLCRAVPYSDQKQKEPVNRHYDS